MPVRMKGLLEIRSLKWLSEKGSSILLKAFRARDVSERKLAARGGVVQESNLELRHVFDLKTGRLRDSSTCFKIILAAKKAGPAVYLSCEYLLQRRSQLFVLI